MGARGKFWGLGDGVGTGGRVRKGYTEVMGEDGIEVLREWANEGNGESLGL